MPGDFNIVRFNRYFTLTVFVLMRFHCTVLSTIIGIGMVHVYAGSAPMVQLPWSWPYQFFSQTLTSDQIFSLSIHGCLALR